MVGGRQLDFLWSNYTFNFPKVTPYSTQRYNCSKQEMPATTLYFKGDTKNTTLCAIG